MKELDVVLLKDGRSATIIGIYDEGEVYLLEVTDGSGRTLDTPTVKKRRD